MARRALGTFELLILLAVMRLEDDAYGVPISREIEETSGHGVAIATVYATLERLEERGLVTSELGDPTPERGGRAKRIFRVTNKGVRDVQDARRALTRLWGRLPQLKGEPS